MNKYVNIEVAKEYLRHDSFSNPYFRSQACQQAMNVLDTVPAADVVEVVHASWEWDPDGMDWDIGAWKCSSCGSKAETWWATDEKEVPLRCAGSHYCGNCGATMRK